MAGGAAQALPSTTGWPGAVWNDVVETDATMGHAALVQVLQHVGGRAQHAFAAARPRSRDAGGCGRLGPGGARQIA